MEKNTNQDKLVRASEFKKNVSTWMDSIINTSVDILHLKTNGTSELNRSLEKKMRYAEGGTENEIDRIAFKFKQYGVFVHYGVGRGYTRINGVVTRGYNLYNKKKRKWRNEDMKAALVKKGYSDAELKKQKYRAELGTFTVLRKPVDFIDGVINRHITELADISGEYYGDKAFKKILDTFDKLKIQKYGKK
ncbi:hypothetical protein [Bacteroides helcogenes]|uniref:Uncharacterized protein n=1 Tax=Bacteroides helcogenes (strain ATCC 35417 / DSM 20613 / JCM 6297 / CCUG 15421 / P 36-108) TaxID=693979 RepID=E6SUP1_BACT6|nr:hypothetical protein [Bacteroides helcogenes]ADV44386.1 hypothetical protein Bache_2420 [Bacteroides helcogenes P 36-108]